MQKSTAFQLLAQGEYSECVLGTPSVTSSPLKFCQHPGLTQEPCAAQLIGDWALKFSSMPLAWQFQLGIFAQYIHHPSSVYVQIISALASKYFISKTSNRQMSL